ncbi:cutinase family protein [Rhodococcus sp. NPDC058514]|uniref:cutinase family protein n=1 Tax=unclassified Rhodococcus (in: high G+C Gram-positive bacteria) TaxID=192944 RepID=UPI00365D3185
MSLKKTLAIASVVAAATIGISGGVAQADASGAGCPNLYVVSIPGTWETGPARQPAPGMLGAVTGALASPNIRTEYVTYAATAFPWETQVYAASKRQATDNARGLLEAMQRTCATTRFGIIGYSQGADAAGDLAAEIGSGLSSVRPEKVAGVGLLSDPRRAETDVLIGPRVQGFGSGGPRMGGFGAVGDRTVTFCAPGDLYCATERDDFVTRIAGVTVQNSDAGSVDELLKRPDAGALWNELLGAGGVPTLQGQLSDQANAQRRDELGAFYGTGAHQNYQGYAVDGAGTTPTAWLAGWLRAKA